MLEAEIFEQTPAAQAGDLGLYLHFPFCVRKCHYCDFLSFPAEEEKRSIYASALIREIRGYAPAMRGKTVSSIFLGGGTPSLMPARELRRIFRALDESFVIAPDAEITMEVNPGTLTEPVLSFIYDEINRVSLGLQSVHDHELKMLGRIHTFQDFERSYELLREAGMKNLNVDLMSAIPGQTADSWAETLRTVAALNPEHISAYSLIIEEGTPFFTQNERGELSLPDEDEERRMYYRTREILGEAGYARYEISNYAKPGFSSRHNLRYWRRGDYLGLGLGASSLLGNLRWKNTTKFETYLRDSADPQKLITDLEELDRKSAVEEFMFLGLRTTEGITAAEFEKCFGLPLLDIYGEKIEELKRNGFLEDNGCGRYYLTDRGVDLSNIVLAEFLL